VPTIVNVSYSNNSALYGNDIATEARSLIWANPQLVNISQTSGSLLTPPPQLQLVDYYSQIVLSDNSTSLTAISSGIAGATIVVVTNGVAVFDGILITLSPNTSTNI